MEKNINVYMSIFLFLKKKPSICISLLTLFVMIHIIKISLSLLLGQILKPQ